MKGQTLVIALVWIMIILFMMVMVHMTMSEPLNVTQVALRSVTTNSSAYTSMDMTIEFFNFLPIIFFVILMLMAVLIAQKRSQQDFL